MVHAIQGMTDTDDATAETGDAEDAGDEESLVDLRFVGDATAAVLDGAGVTPGDVRDKQVSHAQLLDAGVNAGVAAKLRREHSLSWSFESSGDDLDRRASQVRGLDDGERAWVSASAGDWESASPGASADGSGSAEAEEAAWRDRTRPTPVTDIDGVGPKRAEALARGGIRSVQSLANADPDEVADSLDLDAERVRTWQAAATERL
jgi:predicted flap endonuclease-1-like 5' DNA nuclease